MEARLKQSGVFQNLILHLKEQTFWDYAALRFAPETLETQQMDHSKVALMVLSLEPKIFFGSYKCDDEGLNMNVHLDALNRIFQHQEENAVTRLFVDADDLESTVLSVFSEFPDRFHQSDVSFLAADEDLFGIPDIGWRCTVSIPTDKLQRIVEYIDKSGYDGSGTCTIRVVADEGIFFTMQGTKYDRHIMMTKVFRRNQDVVIRGGSAGEDDVAFATSYLNQCIGKTCIASQVSISLKGNEAPLKINYSIDQMTESGEMEKCGSLQYYIAPKVGEEGYEYAIPALSVESRLRAFEARLTESHVLVQLLKAIGDAAQEVEVIISKNKVRFVAFDTFGASFLDVSLASDFFDGFYCTNPMKFGLEFVHVKWALQGVDREDGLMLATDEGGKGLEIRVENSSKDEITVHHIDACEVDNSSCRLLEHPKICTVTMPSKLYEMIVQDLKGQFCTISIAKEGMLFEADNVRSVLDTKHCEVAFDVNEPMEASFGLRFLKQFTLTASFASVVRLSIHPRMLLKLEYCADLSEESIVEYFVAPRLDNNSDSQQAKLPADAVGYISSKFQSGEGMITDLQKTKAAKKPVVRKRKRTASKVKIRPRKKAATRTKPKKCSVCKVVKSYQEYFPSQLSKTTRATCIDCTVVECRRTMMAWRAPRTRRRREVAQRREEVRCMRSLRCERYECPNFFEEGLGTLPENLQASFMSTVPDAQELLGSYDLVYTSSNSEGRPSKQRTIAGELSLESRKEGLLHGSFEISPIISEFTEPGARSFVIAQTTSDSVNSFEIPIRVSEPVTGATHHLSPEGGHRGTVRVLATRTATGWFPHEKPTYNRLVFFDTVEEADVLMKRREQAFLANSWINNHLSLPTELALKIHEYVAFRPPIAFLFEEGDLWVALSWKKANGTVLRTIFVARRRE